MMFGLVGGATGGLIWDQLPEGVKGKWKRAFRRGIVRE
jgi:hypothetical protein